jgi:hypothetical protein
LAIAITSAGEASRKIGGKKLRREWTFERLEALYELAYLRIFAAWEMCLDAIFFRSLCGYASRLGREPLVTGSYFRTIAAAEAAILTPTRPYLLWHNPRKAIDRYQTYFGIPGSPIRPGNQQTTFSANLTMLEHLCNVRHRIAHDQKDAKKKFDLLTSSLAFRIYEKSRPGKFLRDWNSSITPPQKWLTVSTDTLVSVIAQMV